jgi:uncharacterized spore protein YtfJ
MAETKTQGEGERDPARIAGRLGEIFGAAARVNTVFGEPVTQGELTVVPVARARWGMGGGRGLRPVGEEGHGREGVGGGGGMRVDPVGIVVIRDDDAEFRPIPAETRWGLLLGAAALGFLIGRL